MYTTDDLNRDLGYYDEEYGWYEGCGWEDPRFESGQNIVCGILPDDTYVVGSDIAKAISDTKDNRWDKPVLLLDDGTCYVYELEFHGSYPEDIYYDYVRREVPTMAGKKLIKWEG